ncbi:MAG: aminotransferase class I/II-fold pyridoxal phosphate-dependent enzyme [Fidelibacterota bacterium]
MRFIPWWWVPISPGLTLSGKVWTVVLADKSLFPLDDTLLDRLLRERELDLEVISIRELSGLVDTLSTELGLEFLRFEFGIPGLLADRIGPREEIQVLESDPALPSTYPPFDGIPRLKQAAARFVRSFLDIEVRPENCIPTVGAMQGDFICQAIAGRRRPEANTILYLDPGFPVNKLQTRFLGLKTASIDFYSLRGEKLIDEIERHFSSGRIGGLLWSSPNNPTWICLKEEELQGIGSLLTQYDVLGIEDAAYLGMDFRVDYSIPNEPPFPPTIARYTDNYFVVLASSKIFSYSGQRVAITVISPGLMNQKYPYLREHYNTDRVGHAFVHGGIYPTTAGVPQSTQHALAALFEAACRGEYNFLQQLRQYGERAHFAKQKFLEAGFDFVYPDDMGKPIGDGFYFTVSRKGMTGGELLRTMLLFGMSGITLRITGSEREGVRICLSQLREDLFPELEARLSALEQYLDSQSKATEAA